MAVVVLLVIEYLVLLFDILVKIVEMRSYVIHSAQIALPSHLPLTRHAHFLNYFQIKRPFFELFLKIRPFFEFFS